jgi:hypothetical protein
LFTKCKTKVGTSKKESNTIVAFCYAKCTATPFASILEHFVYKMYAKCMHGAYGTIVQKTYGGLATIFTRAFYLDIFLK